MGVMFPCLGVCLRLAWVPILTTYGYSTLLYCMHGGWISVRSSVPETSRLGCLDLEMDGCVREYVAGLDLIATN